MMSQSAVDMKKEKKTAASSLFKKNVKKFMNNKLALLGLLVIVIMTVACIIGAIAGVDYVTPHLPDMKKAPGNGYLFGTDTMGRDLFARVLIGGCYSILIGVFCAVLSSVIGAILGAIAGYFGGKTDAAIIRISEIFQAFPQLVLVMMLVAIVNKRGLGNLLFIFVFTGWMTTFRMVRNEFVSIKGETYVKVCEAFGMSRMNIMFKQILPNVMSPIIVSIMQRIILNTVCFYDCIFSGKTHDGIHGHTLSASGFSYNSKCFSSFYLKGNIFYDFNFFFIRYKRCVKIFNV